MKLEWHDKAKLVLLVAVCLSFVNVLVITSSIAAPWYKVIDFESKAAGWECAFQISRSSFYSWKECECDSFRLPDTNFLDKEWCTSGFYDWRNCENCDTLGCACSLELRIWNTTVGFLLLAFACSGGATILLSTQINDTIRRKRSKRLQGMIHILLFCTFAFLLTAFCVFFRINGAIQEDFGNRCNSGFGVCDSFMGSKENQVLKYKNFYYQYNESWGPLMGFWTALTAIIWTILVEVSFITFCTIQLRYDFSSYESID